VATALSGHASIRLMPTPSRGHGTQHVKTCWYNAAMNKPFQFSMRRMLCATTFFGVAAWLARAGVSALNDISRNDGGSFAYFAFLGCAVSSIAGFGAIGEKQLAKIARPLLLLVLIGVGIYVSIMFRLGDWMIVAVVAFWLVGEYLLSVVANWWKRRRIRR
jgi:hypothetical protein